MANKVKEPRKGALSFEKIREVGRPEYWTEERINQLIIDLEEWLEKDDAICMAGYRAENYLTDDILKHVREKSDIFSRAYTSARLKVAQRLAVNVGKKGGNVHQVHYNKYQSVYDGELKDHEKDLIKMKAVAEAEAKTEMSKADSEKLDLIIDQIKNYHSSRKIDESKSKAE